MFRKNSLVIFVITMLLVACAPSAVPEAVTEEVQEVDAAETYVEVEETIQDHSAEFLALAKLAQTRPEICSQEIGAYLEGIIENPNQLGILYGMSVQSSSFDYGYQESSLGYAILSLAHAFGEEGLYTWQDRIEYEVPVFLTLSSVDIVEVGMYLNPIMRDTPDVAKMTALVKEATVLAKFSEYSEFASKIVDVYYSNTASTPNSVKFVYAWGYLEPFLPTIDAAAYSCSLAIMANEYESNSEIRELVDAKQIWVPMNYPFEFVDFITELETKGIITRDETGIYQYSVSYTDFDMIETVEHHFFGGVTGIRELFTP